MRILIINHTPLDGTKGIACSARVADTTWQVIADKTLAVYERARSERVTCASR